MVSRDNPRHFFNLRFDPQKTVGELHRVVARLANADVSRIGVALNETVLDPSMVLSSCGVTRNSLLHFYENVVDEVQIVVKTITGQSFSLVVPNTSTVGDLKAYLETEHGFNRHLIRLVYSGVEMEDG